MKKGVSLDGLLMVNKCLWSIQKKTLTSIYAIGVDGKSIVDWTASETNFMGGVTVNNGNICFTLQHPSKLPELYVTNVSAYAPKKNYQYQ